MKSRQPVFRPDYEAGCEKDKVGSVSDLYAGRKGDRSCTVRHCRRNLEENVADDVKKSEVVTEPAEGAGGENVVTDDKPDRAGSGSVQKKKRVRRRPAKGEQEAGRAKAEPQAENENKGQKTRKVRKKRADSVIDEEKSVRAEDKPEKKKRVRRRVKPASDESTEVKKKAGTASAESTEVRKKAGRASDGSARVRKKAKPAPDGSAKTGKLAKTVQEGIKENGKTPKPAPTDSAENGNAAESLAENKEKIDIKAKAGAAFATFGAFVKNLFIRIPEKNRKKILGIIGAVLCLYFVFAFVFSFIFMPRTYLNGIKVGFKSYASASKMIKPTINDYVLTVRNLDGSQEHVEGSAVNLKYESMKWIKEALKQQNQFAWPISFFRKNEIVIEENVSYNEAAFADILKKMSGFKTTTMIEPQDAHVAMDETGNYVVYPEVLGTTIDVDAAKAEARECLLTGNRLLDLEVYHILPTVYSSDEILSERLNEWNEYMKSAGLTYIFWDTPEVLTREIINSLISEGKDGLYVDEKKVMNLMAEWRERHDSLGRSFKFMTYDGIEVDITPGGDYGYELNEEAVGADIIEKLNAHDTGSYEVSYWRKPLYRTNNGLGGTYIEISITDQHLWMYKDGELLIDTNVVTGMPTDDEERITHKGCFSVDWHEEHVLLGTMETRGYEQLVDYWIAFNESEGIHDAQWREDSEYIREMYLYDGSHGCVNTPLAAMKVIFENVIDGEAVVIY